MYRFIDEHRDRWPVRVLCGALGVSASGYYVWRDRHASARQQRQDALLVEPQGLRWWDVLKWSPEQHGNPRR